MSLQRLGSCRLRAKLTLTSAHFSQWDTVFPTGFCQVVKTANANGAAADNDNTCCARKCHVGPLLNYYSDNLQPTSSRSHRRSRHSEQNNDMVADQVWLIYVWKATYPVFIDLKTAL